MSDFTYDNQPDEAPDSAANAQADTTAHAS